MVGSRHLRGSVASRVRNLLRSRAIPNMPVWFPVVEAFPPLAETKLNRLAVAGRACKITYPEDKYRTMFYNTFHTYEPLCLWKDQLTQCDRVVDTCMLLEQEGLDPESAFEEATSMLNTKQEIQTTRSPDPSNTQTTPVHFKHEGGEEDDEFDDVLMDMLNNKRKIDFDDDKDS